MATTSAVLMISPTRGPDVGFYVHYDGDEVGGELRAIIDRRGYPAVFEMFRAQPSRFWRELNIDTGDVLPEHVSRFPQNILVSHAVPGYGVLLIGPEELAASATPVSVDPAQDRQRGYRVDRHGVVRQIH